MPPDQCLPPLEPDDPLGRGVFSDKQARKWRSGKGDRRSFHGAATEQSLSVDRLGHASDEAMTRISDAVAEGRGSGRSFYGWAVVSVWLAEQDGRSVRPSPLRNNPYHADIDLNLPLGAERKDVRIRHAFNLAAGAAWNERAARE